MIDEKLEAELTQFANELKDARELIMIALEGKRGYKSASLQARKKLVEIKKQITDKKRKLMEATK